MLAPDDPGRIVAVLDWEMSTLGDPLTDLGLFLGLLGRRDNAAAVARIAGASAACPGSSASTRWWTRYATQTGRDLSNLDFYIVFAFYKLAVILEGINARFLMGKTLGEGFEDMSRPSPRSPRPRSTSRTGRPSPPSAAEPRRRRTARQTWRLM